MRPAPRATRLCRSETLPSAEQSEQRCRRTSPRVGYARGDGGSWTAKGGPLKVEFQHLAAARHRLAHRKFVPGGDGVIQQWLDTSLRPVSPMLAGLRWGHLFAPTAGGLGT